MKLKNIYQACHEGDLDRVKQILEAKPKAVNLPDKNLCCPIFHAAYHGHYDIVEYLIERGADLSAGEGYVLHYATKPGNNKKTVRLLIEHGALESYTHPQNDEDRQFLTALFLANGSQLKSMLKDCPDLVDKLDNKRFYPIHRACQHGDTKIVSLLLDYGANKNAFSKTAQTPLYCAAAHLHFETVKLLLAEHVNINQKLSDGNDILEWLELYAENNPPVQKVRRLIKSKIRVKRRRITRFF